ncbi:hypothetical protein KFU94_04895 [Chloroflexi bacterium TSY]|nr:hypothetical protein [Chloroflexi bacterium TSY]
MSEFLVDNALEAIGVIVAIISLIYTIWNDHRDRINISLDYQPNIPRIFLQFVLNFLSLVVPAYGIFWISIKIVNQFTTAAVDVLYWSAGVTTLFGIGWGIVWATYVRNWIRTIG